MQDCIFCKIKDGVIPAKKLYEDNNFFVISDIEPKCKNHYLAIPKNHYKLLADMNKSDIKILGEIFATVPKLEKILNLQSGYRLIINQGSDAGQSVFHLHIHILSGQKMNWTPA